MPYINTEGARLFYTDEGQGSRTLLLMHGWGVDSNDWVWLIPLLSVDYRIVACDLRGHGHSSVPDDYGWERMVADMVDLVRHVGGGPVVPVGHSLGGALAASMAVEHPGLVEAMVAVDPAYGHTPEFVAVLEAGRTRWKKVPEEGQRLLLDQMTAAGTTLATPEFLRTFNNRRIQSMPAEMVWKPYEGLADATSGVFQRDTATEYLKRRQAPVLAVHSLAGKAAWEKETFGHPYSKAVEWEGSGHCVQIERHRELAQVMIEWLHGLPAGDQP
ncbi:alpha/beta fold hydrolase [Sciscionella marina]|uniref:alpha/beta fold hydrolase n=1 Tax=Sciscionella marina TaxID=508770 RepID=UPI000361588B|nr:alpha/beta hydrolase [Sciscionella marina]